MKRNCKRQGEQAEVAFLWKATRRGFSIAKPYGDSDPYDFILDNGRRLLRVQVKTSAYRNGSKYSVSLRWSSPTHCYPKCKVDFFLIWIEPCDAWYVVPADAVSGRQRIVVYPQVEDSCGRFEHYREAWHLLERKRRRREGTPPLKPSRSNPAA